MVLGLGLRGQPSGDLVRHLRLLRPAWPFRQFIPAAAVASGAQGAFFQTDVDISNADDQAVEYEFSWLPRGEDNSEPATSEMFTLGAGKSARYANVLAEVFDLEPDSLGALVIRSTTPDLLAMSRTYNLPSDKVAGHLRAGHAGLRPERLHPPRRDAAHPLRQRERRHAHQLGCQNGTDATTVVYLDLFDADGTSLGREMHDSQASWATNRSTGSSTDHNPVNGYVDVSVVQAGEVRLLLRLGARQRHQRSDDDSAAIERNDRQERSHG